MNKHQLDSYKNSYKKGFKFHDENILMLSWYSSRVVNALRKKQFKSVLSLGIGHQIVSKRVITELGESLQKYLIIEGSNRIIEDFKKSFLLPPSVSVMHSLFENFKPSSKFDAIEMGFVLEHVDDPHKLLRQYSNYLNPKGTLFIAVPNATSLHRLLGFNAGIINDLYRLSTYDLELGHKRYFDLTSLSDLAKSTNLKIKKVEGIFLKPFTTSQLKSLHLNSTIFEALCNIGVKYPEISNAIYVEAHL